MTLAEFKAWFEGFTEDMSGAPSDKQWKKIKARVTEITGSPLTEHHFYHRYWHPYFYGWQGLNGYSTTSFGQSQGLGATASNAAYNLNLTNQAFDGTSAMRMLGQADALADAA